jgi:hypothetical protein
MNAPLELDDSGEEIGQFPPDVPNPVRGGSGARLLTLERSDRVVGPHGQITERGAQTGRILTDFTSCLALPGIGKGGESG